MEHLQAAGYPVRVEDVADIDAVKRAKGIPGDLTACHTAQVEGYLVEGHVPAEVIDRVLQEKPEVAGVAVAGIAVPGMPLGAPGMEIAGQAPDPYAVISFTAKGDQQVYEQR